MYADHRRVQRREFKEYQPLFMLINSLDIIDNATRREFMCVNGPVWHRFNEATKGASQRRITALFLSNEQNAFDELLFVGCDYVRRRQHQCRPLWTGHALCTALGDSLVKRACLELAGRSVVRLGMLQPEPAVQSGRHGSPTHWSGGVPHFGDGSGIEVHV